MEVPIQVKVLGTGCRKCNKLYEEAQKAIELSGVDVDIEKIEKINEIADYGVALTPALVVDGTVKSSGKLPKAAEIAAWLKEAE